MVVKALLDVVESGNKNIEVMVIGKHETRLLLDDEIEKLIEIAKQWSSLSLYVSSKLIPNISFYSVLSYRNNFSNFIETWLLDESSWIC